MRGKEINTRGIVYFHKIDTQGQKRNRLTKEKRGEVIIHLKPCKLAAYNTAMENLRKKVKRGREITASHGAEGMRISYELSQRTN